MSTVQWGSKYRISEYWKYLNTRLVQYPNGPLFWCLVPIITNGQLNGIQTTIWLMDQSKNWTDPHDLNTRLVRNMDPHCSLIRENVTNPFAVLQNSFYYQEMVLSVSHLHQKSPWVLQLGAGAAPQRLSCQGWGRNPGCRANYTSGLRRNCNGVRSLNRKKRNKTKKWWHA